MIAWAPQLPVAINTPEHLESAHTKGMTVLQCAIPVVRHFVLRGCALFALTYFCHNVNQMLLLAISCPLFASFATLSSDTFRCLTSFRSPGTLVDIFKPLQSESHRFEA
eukprot:746205-Hanusia_phi.AAC.5